MARLSYTENGVQYDLEGLLLTTTTHHEKEHVLHQLLRSMKGDRKRLHPFSPEAEWLHNHLFLLFELADEMEKSTMRQRVLECLKPMNSAH